MAPAGVDGMPALHLYLQGNPSGAEALKETPAGAGCRGTGPPGAPRPSASGQRGLPQSSVPLPQRSALGLYASALGVSRPRALGPGFVERSSTAL